MKELTQKSYHEGIESLGLSILEECEGDVRDMIHETVDQDEWVIYTYYHDQVLRFTQNDDAYLDIYSNEGLGTIVSEKGLDHARMIQVYWAIEQDVSDWLSEQGKEWIENEIEEVEKTIKGFDSIINQIDSECSTLQGFEHNLEKEQAKLERLETILEEL